FYSAQEITDFLPEGGTPDALPNLTVLTGQLVAASLNIGFDAYDADFAGSDVSLGDMFIDTEGFEGLTLSDILAVANDVIGGCSDAYSYPALNAVLTTINENFDNGTQDNGHITCAAPAGVDRSAVASTEAARASSFMLNVYPNPASDIANVQISATRAEIFDIALYSMTGQLITKQQRSIPVGISNLNLEVSELPSMSYVLRVSSANQNKTQIVEVR
ncbi:MAG: T9SS type A sorting domain-containing protein, partial [Flavobacteriales bacterium]